MNKFNKLQLQFLLLALTNFLFISNLYAEPKMPSMSNMPSANAVTAKVAVPAAKTDEQDIPVLPKDISGNKTKAYAGDNLSIINNQESNKPLPIKKKMPMTEKANLENKQIADNKQSSGGLKIIEHGKISTENFNEDSSFPAKLNISTNTIADKDIPDKNLNKESININSKDISKQNLSIIQLKEEIDSLRKEMQELKIYLKHKN